MDNNFKKHLFNHNKSAREALIQLETLGFDAILFIVDENEFLMGSLTDGDIRRGLISDKNIDESVLKFIQNNPKYLRKGDEDIYKIQYLKNQNFRIIPILNKNDNKVIKVINFRKLKSYLPIDALIMAGGKGQRLRPLTNNKPKPLLNVGEKPIIEHNIDRLILFGIDDINISVNYLGEQIVDYFNDGIQKGVNIHYVWEKVPLGTIGSITLVENFLHDYILITNSDILTNLDYENFFINFLENDADFSVVTIPYEVKVPYAVLESRDGKIINFKEKPTFTYYSNGGIYLMKKELIKYIPKDVLFDATDFMQKMIDLEKKIISYPFSGYWLDIGKIDDFNKAQTDIKNINFL